MSRAPIDDGSQEELLEAEEVLVNGRAETRPGAQLGAGEVGPWS